MEALSLDRRFHQTLFVLYWKHQRLHRLQFTIKRTPGNRHHDEKIEETVLRPNIWMLQNSQGAITLDKNHDEALSGRSYAQRDDLCSRMSPVFDETVVAGEIVWYPNCCITSVNRICASVEPISPGERCFVANWTFGANERVGWCRRSLGWWSWFLGSQIITGFSEPKNWDSDLRIVRKKKVISFSWSENIHLIIIRSTDCLEYSDLAFRSGRGLVILQQLF